MIVNDNIKKIMYMGKEISEVRCNNETVWVKQTVKPPPPPKPCTTCQTRCEKTTQCGTCETNLSCGQGCTACLKNQSTETA